MYHLTAVYAGLQQYKTISHLHVCNTSVAICPITCLSLSSAVYNVYQITTYDQRIKTGCCCLLKLIIQSRAFVELADPLLYLEKLAIKPYSQSLETSSQIRTIFS